jgi:hypothetical protein
MRPGARSGEQCPERGLPGRRQRGCVEVICSGIRWSGLMPTRKRDVVMVPMVDGGRGGHPTARCLPDDTTMNLCVRRGGPAAQHIGGRATPAGFRSLGFADCLPPVGEKQYWGEKHYSMPPGGLIRHSRRWSATSRSIPDHRAVVPHVGARPQRQGSRVPQPGCAVTGTEPGHAGPDRPRVGRTTAHIGPIRGTFANDCSTRAARSVDGWPSTEE